MQSQQDQQDFSALELALDLDQPQASVQHQPTTHRLSVVTAPVAPATSQPNQPHSPSSSPVPLTSHELYELNQKQQLAALQTPTSLQPSLRLSGGSLKLSRKQLAKEKLRQHLGRQNSMIVGTPEFRERYDFKKPARQMYHQQQHQPGQIQINQDVALGATSHHRPMHHPTHRNQIMHAQTIIENQAMDGSSPNHQIPLENQYNENNFVQQQQSQQVPMGDKEPPLARRYGLPVQKHFQGYDISSSSDDPTTCCALLLTAISVLLVLVTFPFSMLFCIKVVQEYERVVVFRLGRLLKGGARGPGIVFIMPCIDTYTRVDLRTVSFDVPPQEILSKDSVTVAVDAVVYFRISDATIAVSNVENYNRSTRLLAATTLRNVLGTKNLSEILSEREAISHIMQSALDEATEPWGCVVERVEIRSAVLPIQLQRSMAAEAEAAREARAKIIAAEGEEKASLALKRAAEVISMSPAALQLRYLQTLNSIAAERNSTIVFPLPIELLSLAARPYEAMRGQMPMQSNQPLPTHQIVQPQDPQHQLSSISDSPAPVAEQQAAR